MIGPRDGDHDPKPEPPPRSKTKRRVWTILLAVGLSITVAFLALVFTAPRWLCDAPPPFSADDTDWENRDRPLIADATIEDAFHAATEVLQTHGYTICHELERVTSYNHVKPCVGNCGATTSLKKGIVVAQRSGVARESDGELWAWSIDLQITFKQQSHGTAIALHLVQGYPRYRPETFAADHLPVDDVAPFSRYGGEVIRNQSKIETELVAEIRANLTAENGE